MAFMARYAFQSRLLTPVIMEISAEKADRNTSVAGSSRIGHRT